MPGCALRYCRNTSKNTAKSSGVTFHRFPRALNNHKEEWIQFVRRDRSEPKWSPTEHTYLCSNHFTENDFIYTQTGRKFTKLSAVPSIPSEFNNSHQNVSLGDADADNDAGSVDDDVGGGEKWDATNVAVEGNVVRLTVGVPRVEPGYGLVLEAATVPRVVGVECCVFGCRNNVQENPDKSFFPFPIRPERYNLWLKLINRKDLTTKLGGKTAYRVCSDHFDGFDFSGLNTLKQFAVPHYNLPKRSVNIVYDDSEAGPSKQPDSQVKTEPVETMEIEIQYDPKTYPYIKQEPSSPTAGAPFMEISDPYTVATGGVPTTETQPTLTKKEIFLQNATISPVEHIYLPGVLRDLIAPSYKSTVHVQTPKLLMDQMNAPLRKQYEAEVREIKKNIRSLETKMDRFVRSQMGKKEFQQNCDAYLDEKFATLVKFHVNLSNKASGNRYSTDFKTLALNLFFSSPRSYNFVEKLFHLPSRATTVRSQIPIRTGVNAFFIEYFKAKVDKMSEEEKVCTVFFDYMKLSKNLHYCVNNDFLYGLHDIDQVIGTEPAGYATLIMVKGLYSEWKQPISFAYVADKRFYTELKEWLYKIVALLFDIGLNVKALVMKLGSEFLEFPEVSVAEPYFEVSGRKVYLIFDVPVLFKSARDALMEYDFHIGSKVVKWSHITKFYHADKKQEQRLAPKLTDDHVRPGKEADELKLAIQVFSRTVAAAVNAHVIAKLISSKAKDTVEFIETMNNLFDILNSQKMSDENEFKRAYTGADGQKELLTNTFEYFKALEIKNKHGQAVDESDNFVTGFLITIKSIVSLFDDLQQENSNYLMTKHFSMDCMKIYFAKVRKLGGNCCTKPTPIMFARSFRRLFLVCLVSNTKVSEMDLKTTLTKISDYIKVNDDTKEEAEPAHHNRFLKVAGGDCLKLWPKPGPTYVAGFIFFKCLQKHHCNKLLEGLCSQYNIEVSDTNSEMFLTLFKEYNQHNLKRTDLEQPPEFIIDATLKMDKIFEGYVQRDDKDMYNFGRNVYLRMESEAFELPCECFPLKYMKKLFIRLKIFHMIKHYNTNIKPRKKNWVVSKKRKGK